MADWEKKYKELAKDYQGLEDDFEELQKELKEVRAKGATSKKGGK